MRGSFAPVVLAALSLLASSEAGLSAPAGEARYGLGPLQVLFGRRPVSPEPMNLLPSPAEPAGAPVEAPSTAQPVAPEPAVPRKAETKKRGPRRLALPARLPRSRPQQAAELGELPTAGSAVIASNRPVPEPVTPQPAGPALPARTAAAAAPAPIIYPEILVPNFDALMLGEVPAAEPLITGSVRAGEAPLAHPEERKPENEPLPVRPVTSPVQDERVPAGPIPPLGLPPGATRALSPDERQERAAAHETAAPSIAAPEQLGKPYELVRTLQTLQDQIAGGSTTAFEAQRNLLAEIDRQFALVKPETWKDPRNASALVTYVLSGGPPTSLSRLLRSGAFPAGDEKLMRGALAYVEGRAAEAREQLAEIDARALPGSMGAQVALAQAALSVAADPAKALAQLDTARLLAPGTLVEEAALRREILVAGELGDIPKFQLLARQYLGRFRQSVYAGNFRQRFAAALSRMDFMNDAAQFPRLEELLVDLDPAARLEVYLTVARASAVQGRLVAAKLASERALSLAKTGDADAARAMLYRGSVMVVAADGLTAALDDLQTIDTTVLNEADRALYNAVSVTATSIQTAADLGAARPPISAPEGPAAAGVEPQTEDPTAPVVSRAQAALAAVDTLLDDAALEGAPQ